MTILQSQISKQIADETEELRRLRFKLKYEQTEARR